MSKHIGLAQQQDNKCNKWQKLEETVEEEYEF